MKYALIIFFIPPVMGFLSALIFILGTPTSVLHQYSVHLALNSFYYSKSLWTLALEDKDHPEKIWSHHLTMFHGPWLGSWNFGLAQIQSQSDTFDFQAHVSPFATVYFEIFSQDSPFVFPHQLIGSYNLFTERSDGVVQGSFKSNQAHYQNTYIQYLSETSFLGVKTCSMAAEIEKFIGSPDTDLEIYGLKIDLIPSLRSWRGSLIGAIHADLWIDNKNLFPDFECEVAIVNAKTKRFVDLIGLMTYASPLFSSTHGAQSSCCINPLTVLDLIDLIDPDWGYITLSSALNTWTIRIAPGGDDIQVDAEGIGSELYSLWTTLFPENILNHLVTDKNSWNHRKEKINLSSLNFSSANWKLATDVDVTTNLLD